MTKVEKLENEIQKLDPDEFSAFRDWFRNYDADQWDQQIEKDIRAGKFDNLTQGALATHKAGVTKKL